MDHQHTLQMNGSQSTSFMCSGCKECDFDVSYICENRNCNYTVHKECAEPVKHAVHPFFKNCNFEFYENENAEKELGRRFCDACGKVFLGFYYTCSEKGYDLHPACLTLPFTTSDGEVILKLCHEVPSDCVLCKQRHVSVLGYKFEGWSYVLESDGKSCCHVSCLMDFVLETSNDNEKTTTTRSNDNEKTTTRSKGRTRSLLKFTGKLAVNLLMDIALGDVSSIGTIVEGVEALLSD